MRSHSKLAGVAAALVLATALVAPVWRPNGHHGVAAAQPAGTAAGPALLSGRFHLAEPRSTVEARVDEAIESTVGAMFFLIRGIARDRLRETNDIPERVDIDISGQHVVVRYDDEPYEGTEGAWESIIARGKPTQLLVQREGPRLYLTFREEDGEKLQVHTISEDGRRMWMDVRVTSDRLPAPLTYRVAFRRE